MTKDVSIQEARTKRTPEARENVIRTFEPYFNSVITELHVPEEFQEDAYNELCVYLLELVNSALTTRKVIESMHLKARTLVKICVGNMQPMDESIKDKEYVFEIKLTLTFDGEKLCMKEMPITTCNS